MDLASPLAAGHRAPASTADKATHERRRMVVVVDDNRADRDLHCHLLRLWGMDTVAAADGWEGLVCARTLLPDLVVTDLRMPGLDGWGLIERMRAWPGTADTPVLLVTGDAFVRGDSVRAAGAVEILAKPLELASFRAATERALRTPAPEPGR